MANDSVINSRKSLGEICSVPDKIISVYSLEQHVWADSNSTGAIKARKPELKSIEEFQFDPVRSFFIDIFNNMAAPWRPEKKENPVGQGYWIQAEFGSGKSHLLCVLSALALGDKKAWEILREKETKAGRGKRESLYRFWEEGIQSKSSSPGRGVFVVVKTLVGSGGGTVGLNDKGKRLSEYILEAVKEQLQCELGRNISLFPTELLADRFIAEDLDRYKKDLKKFLTDPRYFDDREFEDVDQFIKAIQDNKTPGYKKDRGNKLWRFYTEYLKVQPHIQAETEDILKHMVETVLEEGYSGFLLVLDEVSLFMKNRDDSQRMDDEKTLVVLSNRLGKVHNLPIWSVFAAQQAIVSKMGVGNIIAPDRLKLVELLKEDKDYYQIVLSRVRQITAPAEIANYYLHYKRGFSWPNSIGQTEFTQFFPFHKPAIEVLRDITHQLTTARSAIHFMHQTLKFQIAHKGNELIRLWELFDEAVRYEEDTSGVHAALSSIRTKREAEYRAFENCKRHIDSILKGHLKVHRDKALRVIQTLFLYFVGQTRQTGLTPEEIANSVLIEAKPDSNVEENIQHYEILAENLKKELRQIIQENNEAKLPVYRFEPVVTGVDPRAEFKKARDEAESNEVLRRETWLFLLGLKEWSVKTRQITIDVSHGVKSLFCELLTDRDNSQSMTQDYSIDITWNGMAISGRIQLCDMLRMAGDNFLLRPIESDQTDQDFAVYISTIPVDAKKVSKLLESRKDPRILVWVPAELNSEEKEQLLNLAAYRRIIAQHQGKESEDAHSIVSWASESLKTELPKINKIVESAYRRGRIDTLKHAQMEFHIAGNQLSSILAPLIAKALSACYESSLINFGPSFIFRREEAVKFINGIVRTGHIPKGAKPGQNLSAVQNFGAGLKIVKFLPDRQYQLDCFGNPLVADLAAFIDDKLVEDHQSMQIETIYKNFMGIGGPKDFGLPRRLVQLFLLCLVREGKIRIAVNQKAGLNSPFIDHANISEIEFSARILDAFTDIQKLSKPENWEKLCPFAAALLRESSFADIDDTQIGEICKRLHHKLDSERDDAARFLERANNLFAVLKRANPYEAELNKFFRLFQTDFSEGSLIDRCLAVIEKEFGYHLLDHEQVAKEDVDDFKIRLNHYTDLKAFLSYDSELKSLMAYVSYQIPDNAGCKELRSQQRLLSQKLSNIRHFIDSEAKLKTELLGNVNAGHPENGTFAALVSEFQQEFIPQHDLMVARSEEILQKIDSLATGKKLAVIRILDEVSAFGPALASDLENEVLALKKAIFVCDDPSRKSLENSLKVSPGHTCSLTLENYQDLHNKNDEILGQAEMLVNKAFDKKTDVFLNPKIRELLTQGKSEPVIKKLLELNSSEKLQTGIFDLCDDKLPRLLSRFLKKIVFGTIRLADFKPSISTLEKEQIPELVTQFQKFVEQAYGKALSGTDKDNILPILKVE